MKKTPAQEKKSGGMLGWLVLGAIAAGLGLAIFWLEGEASTAFAKLEQAKKEHKTMRRWEKQIEEARRKGGRGSPRGAKEPKNLNELYDALRRQAIGSGIPESMLGLKNPDRDQPVGEGWREHIYHVTLRSPRGAKQDVPLTSAVQFLRAVEQQWASVRSRDLHVKMKGEKAEEIRIEMAYYKRD